MTIYVLITAAWLLAGYLGYRWRTRHISETVLRFGALVGLEPYRGETEDSFYRRIIQRFMGTGR